MNIRYTMRSEFFLPIQEALQSRGICPGQRDPIEITLTEEGYDGEILVEIVSDPADEFLSDWEGTDPTRFRPAFVLLQLSCETKSVTAGS